MMQVTSPVVQNVGKRAADDCRKISHHVTLINDNHHAKINDQGC